MAVYAIGDVQGCFDELLALLDRIGDRGDALIVPVMLAVLKQKQLKNRLAGRGLARSKRRPTVKDMKCAQFSMSRFGTVAPPPSARARSRRSSLRVTGRPRVSATS